MSVRFVKDWKHSLIRQSHGWIKDLVGNSICVGTAEMIRHNISRSVHSVVILMMIMMMTVHSVVILMMNLVMNLMSIMMGIPKIGQ